MLNSYIILEGGTWDGNSDDNIDYGTTANIHFHGVDFVWVNRVRSLNGVSEGIKVRNSQRCWITNNYVYRSKLEFPGGDRTGKAGITSSRIAHEVIVTGNIVEDSGGEGIGIHTNIDRVVIANNVVRYIAKGRCYILVEGSSSTSADFARDVLIVNNAVYANHQCL